MEAGRDSPWAVMVCTVLFLMAGHGMYVQDTTHQHIYIYIPRHNNAYYTINPHTSNRTLPACIAAYQHTTTTTTTPRHYPHLLAL